MPPTTTGLGRPWCTCTEAARMIGRSAPATRRILANAGITVQRLPGSPARWARDEVEALAARSIHRQTERKHQNA